jgi:putative CocE/NonD family hydrolase
MGSPETGFNTYVRRKPNDPGWRKQDFLNNGDRTRVPTLHIDSWYDSIEVYGTTRMFEYLSKNSPNQYLIVGPGPHCSMGRAEKEQTMVGERTVGDARFDYTDTVSQWFDHWLVNDGQGEFSMPRVQYYPLESNKWVSTGTWPPASTPKKLSLSSSGHANGANGDGKLLDAAASGSPDMFINDPMHPVPSHGGGCCSPEAALDQAEIEKRNDVLVYTTEPLKTSLDIAGFIKATLYFSSSVPDTDVALKLVDVYPNGKAYNVLDTIQRLRYRDGIHKESLMNPGDIYRVELKQMALASHFDVGHRIRIEVAGSNFPLYERNLNTGGKNFDESNGVVAKDVVYHDADHPSVLELPVVSSEAK